MNKKSELSYEIKKEFIEQSIIWFENMYKENNELNDSYEKLTNFFEKVKSGEIDKEILLDLLCHNNIAVCYKAAVYMLGIHYGVGIAVEKLNELQNITGKTAEHATIRMNSKMTIKMYKKNGYLKIK